jgi:hypothetical protein
MEPEEIGRCMVTAVGETCFRDNGRTQQ